MPAPAYERLIRALLALDAEISVDGGDYTDSRKLIIEDIEASGSAEILVKVKGKTEWAQIITGLDPDETLADFSCGGEIEKWFDRTFV